MKQAVQNFGRFLSGMVMPNIGAFIAWGLIAALFIADGWLPNETIAQMVSPMLQYLLPLLIAYSGGKAVAGQKGAVCGAIAAMGAIASTDAVMFIGAMICGPLGGWCVKTFDKFMDGKVKPGFEMVVNNFSVGIIGGLLAILAMYVIGPVCLWLTGVLGMGVQALMEHGMLPMTAVLVEPAKVMFLNNAINHGIFTPLGTEQALETGRSILFMIESNPGPGLGLLLAYMIAGKGETRASAGAATIIEFVGGIHEIYFPYVLMNPITILGPMIGNIVGIFTLQAMGGGLVAPASPGSIISEMLLTPRDGYAANISGILIAAGVSFAVSFILLKLFGKDADLAEAQAQVAANKAASKGQAVPATASGPALDMNNIRKIVFACDAGMGSSAMGATMVRKKLQGVGINDIEVIHHPVSEIPGDAQIVITQHMLADRARTSAPQARVIPIGNFMGAPEYDALVQELLDARAGKGGGQLPEGEAKKEEAPAAQAEDQPILLKREDIVLNLDSVTPDEAIQKAGEMLVKSGYVEEGYVPAMHERNESFPVAIGSHVAIPHGTDAARALVKKTGLVLMTFPNGIKWGDDDDVKLVIGIAAKGDDHMAVLGRIVEVCETDEDTDKLVADADPDELYRKLNGLDE